MQRSIEMQCLYTVDVTRSADSMATFFTLIVDALHRSVTRNESTAQFTISSGNVRQYFPVFEFDFSMFIRNAMFVECGRVTDLGCTREHGCHKVSRFNRHILTLVVDALQE